MKQDYEILKRSALFDGINEGELDALLDCLSVKAARYAVGEVIFRAGERITHFGLVLSGQAQIYHEDYYGSRHTLGYAGPGELFGEAHACAALPELPVSVVASVESEALFIDSAGICRPCSVACIFHSRLIGNLMNIIAAKNISLTQKIALTAKRTTREKLLAYLSAEAQGAKSPSFSIPFSRQELADYLSVDRSAMSAELGKLRDSGILRFQKNRFELL
jgi:CRP-like cAMP-binding protein